MSALPKWYAQLKWSAPITLAALNLNRRVIPDFPRHYAFTLDPGPLLPGGVFYVGEAKTSLARRLPVYLVDWTQPKASESHKGKGFILRLRKNRGDHGVFLRWVEYGGAGPDVSLLESSLIDFLEPRYNDRDESVGTACWTTGNAWIPGCCAEL